MQGSEEVVVRIKQNWPSDILLPQVFFGLPVEPVEWALTLDDEQYARAKAALASVRQELETAPRLLYSHV